MSETTATVRASRPRATRPPGIVRDPDLLSAYLEDASGAAPGWASGLVRPETEEEASSFLRATAGTGVTVLPQAARSSLTGGASPRGEIVLSVERWDGIGRLDAGRIVVGAGVRLRDLQAKLGERGWYFPPVPTYQEAMVGGSIATDAGGAATFKYGKTRPWVRALRVLLFNGDLLAIERGQASVRRAGRFRIELTDGSALDVPPPRHTLPPLKKISAGYHASDPLDLVDLFIGAEGTLGVVTAATLDLVPRPADTVTGLAFPPSVADALALAAALRDAAASSRRRGDARGPDVRAIELVDGRGLDLLRTHGDARRLRVSVPDDAGAAVLFEMESPTRLDSVVVDEALASAFEERAIGSDDPLGRLLAIVGRWGLLERLELALPGDETRASALASFREAVPTRVNEILAARRGAGADVAKVGGDLIVPLDRLEESIAAWERRFVERGLEFAIWGHASDGNLHPNALPRTAEETERSRQTLLEFADAAIQMGGAPLSEHGVGRSPLKQEMLRRLLGDDAIAGMRIVKRALDPQGRFAPGVLLPAGI